MSYIASVTTKANIPNFAEVAAKHATALDNYRKYGRPIESLQGISPEAMPMLIKGGFEVEIKSSVQTESNGFIYLTSIICCGKDDDDK